MSSIARAAGFLLRINLLFGVMFADARAAIEINVNSPVPIEAPRKVYLFFNVSSDNATIVETKVTLNDQPLILMSLPGAGPYVELQTSIPGTSATLTFTAADSNGASATKSFEVVYPNVPTVKIEGPSESTLFVGQTAEVTIKGNNQYSDMIAALVVSDQGAQKTIDAASARLVINPQEPGTYRVTAAPYTTQWGTLAGDELVLNVIPFGGPRFFREPQSVEASIGERVSFSGATYTRSKLIFWNRAGIGRFNYWQPYFEIPKVQSSDEGRYSVVFEDEGGRVVSAEATLTVKGIAAPSGGLVLFSNNNGALDAPIRSGRDGGLLGNAGRVQLYSGRSMTKMIAASPTLITAAGYFDGGTISLPNVAAGEKAYVQVYAWEVDGFEGGFSTSTMRWKSKILEITAGDGVGSPLQGLDSFSTIKNDAYTFEVGAFRKQAAAVGAATTLRANANVFWNSTGEAVTNLSYQWFMDGILRPGATNSTFEIAPVRLDDAANYSVVVTDGRNAAEGTINLAVDIEPPRLVPRKILINNLPNLGGGWELFAHAGSPFRIEKSEDLKNWMTWKTGVLPIDTINTNLTYWTILDTQGFFRAIINP